MCCRSFDTVSEVTEEKSTTFFRIPFLDSQRFIIKTFALVFD